MNEEKEFLRYSDEELQEFKELILDKLEKAKQDMKMYVDALSGTAGNDIADTFPLLRCWKKGSKLYLKKKPDG